MWVKQVGHLVEPEIVSLQKSLKFGEKLVVVKGINRLHITSAVIQITCDLSWIENTNLLWIYFKQTEFFPEVED